MYICIEHAIFYLRQTYPTRMSHELVLYTKGKAALFGLDFRSPKSLNSLNIIMEMLPYLEIIINITIDMVIFHYTT